MKTIGYLLFAIAISGCAATKKEGISPSSIAAIGLWEEYGPPVYPMTRITLRREDGSYLRKTRRVYDYSKPEIEYQSEGLWKILGNQYWEKLTSISLPMWKDEVGREVEHQILELSEGVFKYVSSDGGTVVERRISGPSQTGFEATKLRKLSQ